MINLIIFVFFGLLQSCLCFEVVWNAPLGECRRFGVDIDVTKYGIHANSQGGWRGSQITIFYADEMGTYPSIDGTTLVYGGIPQKVNITKHMEKCKEDVEKDTGETFSGLGVIDYESWRPLWERNFDSKLVYQKLSKQLVRALHPTWSDKEVQQYAKAQFEKAARNFLTQTLAVAKKMRPNGKWGYYLFPNCYLKRGQRKCSTKERNLNDQLLWMFNDSSALYPSAYLLNDQNVTDNRDYVFRTLQEAGRVKSLLPGQRPIYLYSRIRYRENSDWYTKVDLNNTIKQTHDLGYDGVVIWGDSELQRTASLCRGLKTYVDQTLGPFVHSVLQAGNSRKMRYPWTHVKLNYREHNRFTHSHQRWWQNGNMFLNRQNTLRRLTVRNRTI